MNLLYSVKNCENCEQFLLFDCKVKFIYKKLMILRKEKFIFNIFLIYPFNHFNYFANSYNKLYEIVKLRNLLHFVLLHFTLNIFSSQSFNNFFSIAIKNSI